MPKDYWKSARKKALSGNAGPLLSFEDWIALFNQKAIAAEAKRAVKKQRLATRRMAARIAEPRKYPLVTIAGHVYQVIPDENWVNGCWKFDANPKLRHIKRSWVPAECLMGDSNAKDGQP